MSDPLTNYTVGQEGVNLVKDPLQLNDGELTAAQNAEIVPDESKGGEGALSKRGGLGVLNGSALAGAVYGIISLPLQTTFTRTLCVFLGTADSDTMRYTTDGTTWSTSTTPGRALIRGNRTGGSRHKGPIRGAAVKSQLLYAGNDYTEGTTAPVILSWDGTNAVELMRVPAGPSGDGTPPIAIWDMLTADGKVYFCVSEFPNSAEFHGAVYELNVETGVVRLVGSGMGDSPNKTGGFPRCLVWYQGKLWVGQHAVGSSGANLGRLSSAVPGVDTTWTSEGNVFPGFPISMVEFLGDLYIGTEEQESGITAGVIKRTAATGVYTQPFNTGHSDGDAHVSCLTVFDGALYAVQYHSSATDVLHVKKTTDGTTWTTDLDVDSVFPEVIVGSEPLYPRDACVFDGALYVSFRASVEASATDGIVLKRTAAGAWSKVLTDNINGPMAVMVVRS
jgi:hypothetical protein